MEEGKIVGWHLEGRQYCLRCRPTKPVSKEEDTYPIRKGDPDWGLEAPGYGSVPVCHDCGKEIPTVDD